MFGASRKKFVEGVDGDYHDENMYYSQSSMFPHRSEKDVSQIRLFFTFQQRGSLKHMKWLSRNTYGLIAN